MLNLSHSQITGQSRACQRHHPSQFLRHQPPIWLAKARLTVSVCSSAPFSAAITRIRRRRHRLVPRSLSFEGAIPAGVEVEVKAAEEGPDVEWNPDSKTLRLPINVIEGDGTRRTKLVIFTCNKCGGRTARNVNPVAWETGLVMGQCGTCEVWHVLSAKNKSIYEEIRYKDDPGSKGMQAAGAASGSSEEASDSEQNRNPETLDGATAAPP